MEDFEKKIKTEIYNVKKELKHSKKLQLVEDLNHLNFLCFLLELPFYKRNYLQELKLELNTDIFSFYLKHIKEFDFNFTLIQYYKHFMSNLFNDGKDDIDYKYSSEIKLGDAIDLVFDFFKSYDIRYYNTFKNISEKLIVLDRDFLKNEVFSGTTLCGNSPLTSSRIVLADSSDILVPITLAHETSHVYDFSINHNLTNKQYFKKILSITHEINPYHTELHFLDYLSKYYKKDVQISLKDFDDYFWITIFTIDELFNYEKKSFIKYNRVYNDYVDQLRDFYGRLIAYILYSLNDIEKEIYVRDKIMTDTCHTSLKDILLKEGINLEDYSTHDKVFKLIQKHWN